jgi:hypothetical protein
MLYTIDIEVAKFDSIWEIHPTYLDSNLIRPDFLETQTNSNQSRFETERPEIWDDLRSDNPKYDPIRTRTTRKSKMTRDQTIWNPTRSEPEWPKTQNDPRSNDSKPDPIRTQTTRNLRWPEIRQPETRPDPIRAAYMYLITLKLYYINIKFLFINSICTWLSVYFERCRVKHGFRGGPG